MVDLIHSAEGVHGRSGEQAQASVQGPRGEVGETARGEDESPGGRPSERRGEAQGDQAHSWCAKPRTQQSPTPKAGGTRIRTGISCASGGNDSRQLNSIN